MTAIPDITHDDVLARLALPWIDVVPGRRKLARRNLPPHAHEPGPNVVVAAHPADSTTLDVCSRFRQKHWKPRFNDAHVPSDFAWQIVTPAGERLLLFTWVNWQRNSRQMFEDFCRETGHEFGTLRPDGMLVLGERTLPFRDCRLVHQDRFRPRPPVALKKKSAKVLLGKAEQLLKGRKSRFEEIDIREPFDEEEAHDTDLQQQLQENFLGNMAAYEKMLGAEYGPPTRTGSGAHDAIPVGGLVRHAVWSVGKKSLYLALSHEDTELPWVLYLGVLV